MPISSQTQIFDFMKLSTVVKFWIICRSKSYNQHYGCNSHIWPPGGAFSYKKTKHQGVVNGKCCRWVWGVAFTSELWKWLICLSSPKRSKWSFWSSRWRGLTTWMHYRALPLRSTRHISWETSGTPSDLSQQNNTVWGLGPKRLIGLMEVNWINCD